MLEEEGQLDEATINGLIGPFLTDIGVNVEEVCKEIASSLVNGGNNEKASSKATDQSNDTGAAVIRKPFNAGNFLTEAQSGRNL